MSMKKLYGTLLQTISQIGGVDFAKKFDARLRFHRTLNLKKPQSLADKVSYIELHQQSPLASKCTDKYAVRQYVKDKGLEEILVPLAGGPWNSADEIDFDSLPDSFALKATHGCKMNYLVPDKSELDMDACKSEVRRWLSTTYGTYSMEPHYIKIPHRVYAEKFLEDVDGVIDYKFHCLNGTPQFVLVCSNRSVQQSGKMSLTLDLFDMNWKGIPEVCSSGTEVPGAGEVSKPETFARMIEIARKLSEDFQFVRVDLYEMNRQVFFGELTFSPACCVFPYFSENFLNEMGTHLTLHS